MSTRNILLAAIGGAAAAAVLTNYLGTEKGKQLLSDASGTLKDLAGKAAEFAKTNLTSHKTTQLQEPVSQPS